MILPEYITDDIILNVDIKIPIEAKIEIFPKSKSSKNLVLNIRVKIPTKFKIKLFLVRIALRFIYKVLGYKAEYIKITTDKGTR